MEWARILINDVMMNTSRVVQDSALERVLRLVYEKGRNEMRELVLLEYELEGQEEPFEARVKAL